MSNGNVMPICPILLHAEKVKSTLVAVTHDHHKAAACIGVKCILFMQVKADDANKTLTGNCSIAMLPMVLSNLHNSIVTYLDETEEMEEEERREDQKTDFPGSEVH